MAVDPKTTNIRKDKLTLLDNTRKAIRANSTNKKPIFMKTSNTTLKLKEITTKETTLTTDLTDQIDLKDQDFTKITKGTSNLAENLQCSQGIKKEGTTEITSGTIDKNLDLRRVATGLTIGEMTIEEVKEEEGITEMKDKIIMIDRGLKMTLIKESFNRLETLLPEIMEKSLCLKKDKGIIGEVQNKMKVMHNHFNHFLLLINLQHRGQLLLMITLRLIK